jgi:hypothetical protein
MNRRWFRFVASPPKSTRYQGQIEELPWLRSDAQAHYVRIARRVQAVVIFTDSAVLHATDGFGDLDALVELCDHVGAENPGTAVFCRSRLT